MPRSGNDSSCAASARSPWITCNINPALVGDMRAHDEADWIAATPERKNRHYAGNHCRLDPVLGLVLPGGSTWLWSAPADSLRVFRRALVRLLRAACSMGRLVLCRRLGGV